MATILSPHLDDAVLSLGQFMQTEPCTVITIFAGIPEGSGDINKQDPCTFYDESCGFSSSHDAMKTRRQEDLNALALLGAYPQHLDYFDQQYSASRGNGDYKSLISEAIADLLVADAFVPLGIGHPDHRMVAECVRERVPVGMPLFHFEELPYRVEHPEQAHEALMRLQGDGFAVQSLPFPLAQGSRDVKAKAVAAYTSQFPNGADDPMCLCPERVWRAVKTA